MATQSLKVPEIKQLAHIIGVYFLFDGDDLVYVGQSRNVLYRVGGHLKSIKEFDSYGVVECEADQLDSLEAAYIKRYQPILNTVGTNPALLKPSVRVTERRANQMKASPMSDAYWSRRLSLPEKMIRSARRA